MDTDKDREFVRRAEGRCRRGPSWLAVAATLVIAAAVLAVIGQAGRAVSPPVAAVMVLQNTLSGGVPLEINHQGLVMVSRKRFDGVGAFRFAFVDRTSGLNLWTNDGSAIPGPGMPTDSVALSVDKGIYSVRLGDPDLANMTPIPTTVFSTHGDVALRIWFDDQAGHGIYQLEPDHPLTSVPYAYHAATADQVVGDVIPSGVIVMWSGPIIAIPSGWALCDGNNGTPDLSSRFIKGVPGAATDPGATGGALTHAHAVGSYSMPAHTHTGTTNSGGGNIWIDDNSGGTDYWGSSAHTHSFTTNSAGGGTLSGTSSDAGSLPPYYELAFIMKL